MPQVLTEEGAREKVCPFMSSRNQANGVFVQVQCMGSACACWSWVLRHEVGVPYTCARPMPSDDGKVYGRCEAGMS